MSNRKSDADTILASGGIGFIIGILVMTFMFVCFSMPNIEAEWQKEAYDRGYGTFSPEGFHWVEPKVEGGR